VSLKCPCLDRAERSLDLRSKHCLVYGTDQRIVAAEFAGR
jgi:hypothetical protein